MSLFLFIFSGVIHNFCILSFFRNSIRSFFVHVKAIIMIFCYSIYVKRIIRTTGQGASFCGTNGQIFNNNLIINMQFYVIAGSLKTWTHYRPVAAKEELFFKELHSLTKDSEAGLSLMT